MLIKKKCNKLSNLKIILLFLYLQKNDFFFKLTNHLERFILEIKKNESYLWYFEAHKN